jgi:hypothetical protein
MGTYGHRTPRRRNETLCSVDIHALHDRICVANDSGKAAYIKAHGLGGGYVWAVKDDDANGTLTKALAAGLNP